MTTNLQPIPNPVIGLREESDAWAFLYNPDTNKSFSINPTGVMIWKLIDGQRTVADIIAACEQQCANVPSDIDAQIMSFIKVLAEHDIVEIAT